ncbi:hypothetical protein C9988_03820 [Pseudidiomarina aestuarii]|uniref:Uncharacterized protein n=1 Tax=Pseudidiomarina aestuarii TaxID=624146 RepID=A0A2T4CNR2_9GAMM|nr:hypothetical protein C9986_00800 [Pseudidiomarina aestuarii]PTB84796.1 hypothetical protein C9988_03820 [Pseudidiomarina aestuarii]
MPLTADAIEAIGLIALLQFLFFLPVLLFYYLILKFVKTDIQLRPWQQFSLGVVAGIVEWVIYAFWSDPSVIFNIVATTGILVTLSISISQANQAKT